MVGYELEVSSRYLEIMGVGTWTGVKAICRYKLGNHPELSTVTRI